MKPNIHNDNIVGIDICQEFLDVHYLASGKNSRINYTPAGLTKLANACKSHQVDFVVMEATGNLERKLVKALDSHGINLAISNPKRVRDFAKSQGVLAKTDKLDAKIIAEFGHVTMPRFYQAPNQLEEELCDLTTRKDQIKKQIHAENVRRKRIDNQMVIESIEASIAHYEEQLKKIEKAIMSTVESDRILKRKYEILLSIPCIGERTAAYMVARMPELGKLTEKEIASLCGVAPICKESGNYIGKRSIFGGRKHVRRNLYMSAMTNSKKGMAFSDFYALKKSQGKRPKVIITAVMRKLIILMNALIRKNEMYQTDYAKNHCHNRNGKC